MENTEIVKSKRGRPRRSDINKIVKVDNNTNVYQLGKGLNGDQFSRKSISMNKQYIVSLNVSLKDIERMNNYNSIINELELPYIYENESDIIFNIPNLYPVKTINICPSTIPIEILNDKLTAIVMENNSSVDESISVSVSGSVSGSGSGSEIELGLETGTEHINEKNFVNNSFIICPLLKDKYGKAWPVKSPYLCWNCDMEFNGCPVGIPDKEYMGKYYCYGNFCWFSCAARYIYERETQSEYWRKYSLLCVLYQQVYNLSDESKIKLAPSKELRLKYGGNLKDKDFRDLMLNDVSFEYYKLPLVPIYLHISQVYNNLNISNVIENNKLRDHRVIQNEKKFIPINLNDVKKSQENLKKYVIEKAKSSGAIAMTIN